ncbi:phosphoribosylformylglycinamidine synthase I [Candidatus Daviesbacteria bacterium]|nr:phosphoribosylformylglycinamidine synthase I [Candidatus Daviesbacteria bacterium]
MKPKICVLKSDGTNCDEELYYAFEKVGGDPELVHINEVRNKNVRFKDFQVIAFPGGFSYGDDIASGKILAVEMVSFLKEELENFRAKNGVIIGICNGFQTLIRTGLLPFGSLGKMDATLAPNDSGHFECRWVRLKKEKVNKCKFLQGDENIGWFAVNHGEGKLFAGNETIKTIEQSGLVVFRYVDENNRPTQKYPNNPNGSINAIAGICDPKGLVFGMMPHPEKFVDLTQYPNWRREKIEKPHGLFIFENIVKFARVAK